LHPLYSADLAPSDFWPFEYVKGVLQRSSFDESGVLLSVLYDEQNGVDRESLNVVFQEWMIRSHNFIVGNGECAEWCLNWNVQFFFLNMRSWDITRWWTSV
jgi:hypothetical protein